MSTKIGAIKWFNEIKGIGFIRQDDGGRDVFIHYRAVRGEGYHSFYAGDLVEYEVEVTDQGLTAINVVKK